MNEKVACEVADASAIRTDAAEDRPLASRRAGEGVLPAPSLDQSFLRAENEDDDGYDPYSDRPAPHEPLFEADPWA